MWHLKYAFKVKRSTSRKLVPIGWCLREARRLPAGAAELRVTVGGNTTSQQIILSPRADCDSTEVNYW